MSKGRTDEEVMLDLVVRTAAVFFKFRAIGRRMGAMTEWGGGSWGLMRSLVLEGPQTVPQLAASRPVARQRIQLIANELAADGLVEFVDNPAHKRSRLLAMTDEGRRRYEEVQGRLLALCGSIAAEVDPDDLRVTLGTMDRIETLVGGWLEEHPE